MHRQILRLSARSRIYLIAIVAIVIPTLLLVFFGYQLIDQLRQLKGENQAKRLRDAARDKITLIETEILSRELRIRAGLDLKDPDRTAEELGELEKSEGIIEQSFLLDADYNLVYPQPRKDAASPAPGPPAMVEDPVIEELRRQGEQEEFITRNPAAALGFYIEYLNGLKEEATPLKTSAALDAIAGVYFNKLKDYDNAASYYQQLIQSASLGESDPSRLARARYQLGLARANSGKLVEAVRVLLALYEDLVGERTNLKDEYRIRFLKERTAEVIDGLVTPGGLPEDLMRRYEAVKREAERREKKKEFLEWLKMNKYLVMRLEKPEPGSEGPGFRHLQDQIGRSNVLIAYTFFRPEGNDTDGPWLLGFKADLEYLKTQVVAPHLEASEKNRNQTISVLDRNDKVVFGQPLDDPNQEMVSEEFRNVLKFWKLGIVDHDPSSPLNWARKFSRIYTSLNLLIFVIILVGVILTIKDMSRELEISRLKSNFVSSVSHELKTPLALIRMFAETLELGRVKDPAKVQEYYNVIIRESERLTQLINNVLDFSRIESGRRVYEFEPSDIGEIVRETVDAYRYDLDQRGFQVQVDIQPELPIVTIDRNAIGQAVLNLLSNAVKYSPGEKFVRVDVRSGGPNVLVSVSDRGMGISRAEQDKIFEVFYRSSDEAVRRTKGTGIGLALVKHAVESHGGQVRVESQKGAGSTFTIVLPLQRVA